MSRLSDKVQECIYSRIIGAALDKGYSLTDLMENYMGRLNRLHEAHQNHYYTFHNKKGEVIKTKRTIIIGLYNRRESRMLIKAWQGTRQEYEL